MTGRTAVLLAVAVALAGCGLFPGGGTPTPPAGSGTPTGGSVAGTPAAGTPTATPTPEFAGVTFPPGVTEGAVTDREALLSAHAAALDGESATVAIDFRLTVNGTGQNVSLRGKTVPGVDRGWIRVSLPDGTGTYYTAAGTTYKREVVGGETTYGTTDRVSALPQQPRFGADQRIRQAIDSANWTATGVVERNGTRLIRLAATDVEVPEVNTTDGTTVASSGELLVDERGVVHHVAVETRVETPDGGTVRYGLSVTLSSVGATSVEEPDWVDRARN